jgi:hypothetical protein
MAPNQSNLSDRKYLYDFVVYTTQESINSLLVQYLPNTGKKQPVTFLCFLADENGDPTKQVTLDEILQKSRGINPFDIPPGQTGKMPDSRNFMPFVSSAPSNCDLAFLLVALSRFQIKVRS